MDRAALPKYVQLSEMLIREIAAGHLADGARLPPEREMAADLSVSVGTLRKALSDLETKGLLERVQGSGNYVQARTVTESVYAFFRLELKAGGGLPTAEVLSVDRLPKPSDAPAFGAHSEGHRIRRLRRLSGTPAAVEEIWLDAGFTETVAREDLSESLYLFYKRDLGLIIDRAEDRLGVAKVPDWAPVEFGRTAGETLGFIERVSWAQDGAPAEFSRTWFDDRKVAYINRLK